MFVTYSAWISRIVLAIAQLLITRILVQYLGVESYGYFVIILSFATWMSLTDFGFGSVFQNIYSKNIAFNNLQNNLLSTFKSFQILLGLIWVPILAVFAIYIPSIIKADINNQSSSFVFIIMLSLVGWMVTAVMGMTYKLLYSMGKGYWSNIYPAIGSICSVLLLYFFVDMKFNLTHKYENALFSIIVPNLLIVCFVAHRLPGKYELRISKIYSDIRPLFKSSLGFFIFSLLVALITNLDYIIMSRILEEGAIAEYSILSKIFTFAYSFFYAALMTYWPIFSEKIYSKNFNYVNLIIKKILIYFFVFAVIGTIVFLNFKDIISDILTNGNIQLSIAPILAFSLYYLVRGFCDVYAVTIACTNKTKIFLLYMPIQVIVSIVLQLLLGRQYGIVGITLGLAISFLATAAWINFAEYRKMARGYLNKFNEEN